MRISVPMLLFALFDSGLAFLLIFNVAKAKFGGDQKGFARFMGAFLGTLTFIAYFGVIVWFNTYPVTAPEAVKTVVYWAPIVLSLLTLLLVQLSKPFKRQSPEGVDDEAGKTDDNSENEENAEDESPAQ